MNKTENLIWTNIEVYETCAKTVTVLVNESWSDEDIKDKFRNGELNLISEKIRDYECEIGDISRERIGNRGLNYD